jgi:ABC-2 type transport system permease protein
MRSFSDESKGGTFEILQTKPLRRWQIVAGKYAGALGVVLIAVLPTIIYAVSMQSLSAIGGIDKGGTIGSYIGLLFLAAVFVAIGVCCSSFTSNAVVAFISAAFVCFVLYTGFGAISKMQALASGADYYVEMLGIDFHYRSVSRGVLDTRDLVYFFSVILFFLVFTHRNLIKR